MEIKNKLIYYWSPALSKVATCKAVINSVYSFNKYSKVYKSYLIDACGEWEPYTSEIYEKKINLLKLNIKYFKLIFKEGYLASRISYLLIFFLSFFSLHNILKKNKPDYLIVHLITSLPLILFCLFNFDTKLILRISGLPKLNFFRRTLWKISNRFLYRITCPTEETKIALIQQGIFNKDKIFLLRDPVIQISKILEKKKENIESRKKQYILAAGRLTRQKNQILLIKLMKSIVKKNTNLKLIILGEGEKKNLIEKEIKKENLEGSIELIGYQNNIFKYLKNCKCFISTSLWEDPGFVMIEAAATNCFIISSDCRSGPKEFIGENRGLLFKNNDQNDLINKFYEFETMQEHEIFKRKTNAKKQSNKYSIFSHYKEFLKIL
jgi:glycosyltransferase involved in cell wall biosynthesis